jgi:hypothetical protein
MLYLALGFAVLALLAWGIRGTAAERLIQTFQWRLILAAMAVACFAAAAFVSMRGGWGKGIVLFVLGLWMATAVRTPRLTQRPAGRAPATEPLSAGQARSILGVGPDATRTEIEEAYRRLMRRAHPDQGGTTGLAAQLNAARERLLKG